MEKTVSAPGAWSKRVVPILLLSHGCIWAKHAINHKSGPHLPFPLRASCARIVVDSLFISWWNLQEQRLNASPERKRIWCMQWRSIMTCRHFYLYVHKNNLLHCNPFSFNIWHVCVLLRVSVCVISRVYRRCAPAYRSILLTCSLNKK